MRDLFRGGTRRRLASLTVAAVTGLAVVGIGLGPVSAAGAVDVHHEPAHHVFEHRRCVPIPGHHSRHWSYRFWKYWMHHHHRGLPFCAPTPPPPAKPTTTTTKPHETTTTKPATTSTTEATTTTTVAVTTTTAPASPTTVATTTTTAPPTTTTTAPPTTTTTTVPGPPPCPGVIVNGICVFVG